MDFLPSQLNAVPCPKNRPGMPFNGTLGEVPGLTPARIIFVAPGEIEVKVFVRGDAVAMSVTLDPELLPLAVAVLQVSCSKHPQATPRRLSLLVLSGS